MPKEIGKKIYHQKAAIRISDFSSHRHLTEQLKADIYASKKLGSVVTTVRCFHNQIFMEDAWPGLAAEDPDL